MCQPITPSEMKESLSGYERMSIILDLRNTAVQVVCIFSMICFIRVIVFEKLLKTAKLSIERITRSEKVNYDGTLIWSSVLQ
jgi:hypothetical protein